MSLTNLKALAAERTERQHGCRVSVILASLDEDDRTVLAAALEPDSGFRHTHIARALRADGYDISRWTVNQHRIGNCNCEVTK